MLSYNNKGSKSLVLKNKSDQRYIYLDTKKGGQHLFQIKR